MSDETIVILGIPVDNLTMDMAVNRIFSMVDDYAGDGRARLVATVNVDFLVNTHAWFRKHIRHPELLDILRRADLVTADGMPIVWASKLLGNAASRAGHRGRSGAEACGGGVKTQEIHILPGRAGRRGAKGRGFAQRAVSRL